MSRRPVIPRLATLLAVLSMVVAALVTIPARPAEALTEGEIVFVTDRWDGYGEIALREADGDVVNLTNDGADANYSTPVVSPDGSKIAYKSDTSPTGLYVMNADGSGQTRLTDNSQHPEDNYGQWTDLTPSWNATSDELVFARYGNDVGSYHQNQEIYKVSIHGGAPIRLTNNSDYDGDPAWSPDGTTIAFLSSRTGGTGIYTMGTSGGSQTLKKSLSCSPGELDWPVSSTAYFSCIASGKTHVYSVATASDWSATPTDLTATTDQYLTSELSPSGDSDSVVFSSYRDGNNELYEMDTDGTDSVRRTNNSDNDREPDYVSKSRDRTPGSTNGALAITDVEVDDPDADDAFLTRGITITGPGSGVLRYEYGWSSSLSATSPGTVVQSSTSSTGRISFRTTTPGDSYRLLARAVGTNGTYGAWYGENLTTPEQPIWVGVGDSVSSGHHQDDDFPHCPDPADAFV